MLFKVIDFYADIVSDFRVERFRRIGSGYQVVAVLILRDESVLFVKDYVFHDNTRKYAFHWQTNDGRLIGRWDNAPHWPDTVTFPHHFHNGRTGEIENSDIRKIEHALEYIRVMSKKMNNDYS